MRQGTAYIFGLFIVSSYSLKTSAQNLVTNPGFEQLQTNPNRPDLIITIPKDWIASYMMGTDYYNASIHGNHSVPNNEQGYQEPHSGRAYAGICIDRKFIEYLQVKLLDTLAEGEKYLIEFYISRGETSKTNLQELGIVFSEKVNKALATTGLATEPNVKFIDPLGYKDKRGWTKLSAVYQAKGFECYFLLGHFTYDHPVYKGKYCHYYIDDLSITPVEKDSVVNVKTIDSIPKSFSPKLGETVTLKNIFFTTNKSELLPTSFIELDKLVQYLNATRSTWINISGHTDDTGNEGQNKTLSEARAKAVADYLILKGVEKSRIKYFGYGSSRPIATNDTDEGRKQNRRVEFIIN